MDFHSSNGSNTTADIDMWGWQGEDYCLPRESQLGLPQCLWDDNNQKDESLLYIMGNQTPVRECGDLGYDIIDTGDNRKRKGLGEDVEVSRVKRRRVLQFTSDADGTTADNEQLSSAVTSKVQLDSVVGDDWPENIQWDDILSSDDRFLFSNEVLDQSSSDEWLENYFNDSEMSSSKSDHVKPDGQIDVSESCNTVPDTRTNIMPKTPSSTLKIFRGRKSYINSPTKSTTSVAYPFTLVKPCQVQGHMTLKDINQRIHAPPPSRSHKNDEDPSIIYPTSAFSGKPVVVKTKILTGGKGSITILRTKG